MAAGTRTLVADRGDAGVRLDLVLRRHLADLDAATRTRVQRWIQQGQVALNGTVVRRASTRAALGDAVTVALPDEIARRPPVQEDVALDVLYEDAHLIVVNKPAGIVVHPTYKHSAGTVVNALAARARAWPPPQRPSVVGRLDKDTSGIVLAAKTAEMHAALQRALAGSRPAKEYLAVVCGTPPEHGRIDLPLRLDARDRRQVVACLESGAPSATVFTRLSRAAPPTGVALLLCRLVTGRRHQIRVHLAARGWPIVGDTKYGSAQATRIEDPALEAAVAAFPRQALHAWRLSFVHPATGNPVRIEAQVPADMAALLAASGLRVPSSDVGEAAGGDAGGERPAGPHGAAR